jgi:uncharacterized protein YndB with AHSA1/START domain
MIEKKTPPPPGTLVLVVRRTINGNPERLFDAWTRSEELLAWWGPRPVRCTRADVDLRVGGRYRIDNLLPTGDVLTIGGEFTLVERPHKLVYTWSVTPGVAQPELVTVRFDRKGPDLTEVVVTHERIESAAVHNSHATGWSGCLDGLALHVASN